MIAAMTITATQRAILYTGSPERTRSQFSFKTIWALDSSLSLMAASLKTSGVGY
jgi:hypothetical protein